MVPQPISFLDLQDKMSAFLVYVMHAKCSPISSLCNHANDVQRRTKIMEFLIRQLSVTITIVVVVVTVTVTRNVDYSTRLAVDS